MIEILAMALFFAFVTVVIIATISYLAAGMPTL